MAVSIGVAGTLGAEAIAQIAPAVEAHGFSALWVNDTPTGDALAALAAAASVTTTLGLATGVLPVDRWTGAAIAERVRELPRDRVTVGIGSGASRAGSLDRVRRAADEIAQADAGIRVVVGALGPKMQALGTEVSDGLLLSWLSPAVAADLTASAHGRRPGTRVALYARAAVDVAATRRVDEEGTRYASYPNYAAHFARTGVAPGETVVLPTGFAERVRRYEASVDEVVLRAITVDDDAASIVRFVEEAAALRS